MRQAILVHQMTRKCIESCAMTPLHVATLLGCLFSTSALADTTSTFTLPSDVDVTIVESVFDKEMFNVERCSPNRWGSGSIGRINGRVPYGIDINVPETYVKSITISYQGAAYELDVTDMYNAWGDRPLQYPGGVRYFGGKCFDKKHYQFRGLFSDAAGAFVAEWRIVDAVAIRTVLTFSDDVVHLFGEYMDPPEYD